MDSSVRLSELIFPAYRDAWRSRAQYVVIGGSKGSGKSKFHALWHIFHMMRYPDANTLVIRRTYNSLRDSAYTDMLWAIERLGVTEFWEHTVSPLQLTYKPTGQVILFRGLDDPLKIASISVVHGLLTWIWFEEAFDIKNYQDVLKITMSIRGQIPPETGLWKRFAFSFNPWNEHHWLKEQFFDVERDDALAFITTYKDNLKLGEDDIARYEALRITNPRAARVICDGEWGRTEGLIYDNWVEEDFNIHDVMAMFPRAKTTFGLDFGYAISYNAFVAVLVDIESRNLWIFDEMYDKGVSNMEIAKRITEMGYAKEQIWADAAEPKSIYELQQGFVEEIRNDLNEVVDHARYCLPNIRPALKGPDSVRQGISNLQSFKMHVHPKCVNTIIELENYAYDQDKDGKYLDKPIKEWDHVLDGLRYSMARFFVSGKGKVVEAKGMDALPAGPSTGSRRVGSTAGPVSGTRSKWVASSK